MLCSKEEALVRLFYNVSSSFHLLLLFLYVSSVFLSKLFCFLGSNPFQRYQNEYEFLYSDEEEGIDCNERCHSFESIVVQNDHLVADIIRGGESLSFLPDNNSLEMDQYCPSQDYMNPHEDTIQDQDEINATEVIDGTEDVENTEEITEVDSDSVYNSLPNHEESNSWTSTIDSNEKNYDEYSDDAHNIENKAETKNTLSGDENFLVFAPTQLEKNKFIKVEEKENHEEVFGDSYTVGSTSKSSSEWRSSINCRDSGTEDPFSSSSRRSCNKWESYTVFQKYDEEMMFLDRISAQKLHETESLRSIKVCPRSISDRIVHKFATVNKKPLQVGQNPYHELEGAYVAQICLTWEALNWNYKNFTQKRALRQDLNQGCPAQVAQQFQQFHVLLQRYVENEPYEQGRRPEIYARMRLLAPKLLQVPEYRDSIDDKKDEGFGSRILSDAFLMIMEDCIRTFMNFLKADKEKPCQILTSLFKRKRRGSVDPTFLHLVKKINHKKKKKLKDLWRAGKCLRKKSMRVEEEMEILMGQIDLKVVSRVLRMNNISEEQMHWCEEKMSKVRVSEGKLQRDSSPLFFPAH